MPQLDTDQPGFSTAGAARFAYQTYGLTAVATPLPSYADQNFLLTAGEQRFVLKIARADETEATLDLQNEVLRQVARQAPALATPQPQATLAGDLITTWPADDGQNHFVRLVNFVPADLLADVQPRSLPLLTSLGRVLGQLDNALADFSHPAMQRSDLKWDLRHAHLVADCLADVADPQHRALAAHFVARYETVVRLRWSALPLGVVHHDANEHNVLVGPARRDGREVIGLIDFGDVLHSAQITELAVALAYAMMDRPAPLVAATAVIRGYHATRPLTELEVDVLFDLIGLRLSMSGAYAARQRRRAPDNAYVSVSEASAWRLLTALTALAPRLATATFRDACGWAPLPRTYQVLDYLRTVRPAPVIDAELESESLVLDLSVASPLLAALPDDVAPEALARHIAATVDAQAAAVGIGRYDEPRLIYPGDAFAAPFDEQPERRTIHLGVDLFLPAGAPVYAPIAGVVHSVADNAARYDYGPTLILRHDVPALDEPFFTLYGHMSRESLAQWSAGRPVAAGARLGSIGAVVENGRWPPHLHLQLIVDMLDYRATFPGVAAPTERNVWRALSPDPNLLLGRPPDRLDGRDPAAISELRDRYLGPSLSLAYRPRPLKIVRGRGQYLYDHMGRQYLDAVNNVAHVGHAHPHVVAAERRQAAVLNTNTRYLHDHIVTYAARLTATFPAPLSVCFFVGSGSEANDLALRLAYAHTGRRDIIVLDGAYHGNLSSLIAISPYKFNGPGGAGRPDHVQVAAMPDLYRGPFGDDAAAYVADLAAAVVRTQATGPGPAAFIAESVLGCGGQVVLPEGYLAATYAQVRDAGGVCIADEVQVGFGRVGSHFWGFETQHVVPDIVTLGKPIGNGHPLAAVVTTPAIAAAFANGMEYFNTYGGNPVSCAVGLAVLDVLASEKLPAHAAAVGATLLAELRGLQARHPVIGEVRGLGLFLGIELVQSPDTRTPAAAQAAYAARRLREHGLLLSTDGPNHNVLKIKPPLVFSQADGAHLVATLDKILGEDFMRV